MWHHYKQLLCQKFRSLLRLTTTRCIGVIKPNRQLLGQEYRHRLFCYKWQAWLPSVRHSSSLCPFRFSSSTTSQRQTDLKPFKAIPGPRPLPFVGNLFRYIIGINLNLICKDNTKLRIHIWFRKARITKKKKTFVTVWITDVKCFDLLSLSTFWARLANI